MPANATKLLGVLLALAGLATASALWGCAANDGLEARDGDATPGPDDDGGARGQDADVADAAIPGFDGSGPAIDAGSLEPDENAAADGRGCFDFVDSDGDARVDCADDQCSITPLCCLGSSAPGCCTLAAAPTAHDFTACTGSGAADLATCRPELVLFGSPLPDLRDQAVVPNGGDRYDSGLVLPEVVDPRVSVVHVTARVLAAADADPVCSGCIDLVGIGLVSGDTTFGATSTVSPDAAVVVNNTRREVRLLVGDDAVRTWPFTDVPGGAADATYELIASPSGTLALGVNGTTLIDGIRWAPAGPARVVAYGRTANPGGGDPAGVAIASLTVGFEVCDAPASIARTGASILPERVDPWWTPTDQPTSPSISGTEMLFAFDGRIHRARATSEGRFRATSDPHDSVGAILIPVQTEPWRSQAVGEPELVHDGTRWVVYFTARGDGGRRVIGRALGGATLDEPLTDIAQFYPPVGAGDDRDYDGPSYVRTTVGGTTESPTREYLAVRRHTALGGEIVLLALGSGVSEAPAPAGAVIDPDLDFADEATSDRFVHRARRGAGTFDADEIAAPGLVAYDGLVRLYFAGRRGTRWSIGMLASSDGLYWHLVDGGEPLLTGSGAGFDAISVGEPEPVWIGDELRLYYTAHDGVRRTIGMGHHRVTEVAE